MDNLHPSRHTLADQYAVCAPVCQVHTIKGTMAIGVEE